MPPRVISYIRFSTVGQSLGDSEKRQVERAEEYCREHGLTLAPEDDLRDLGLSAYRGTHRKEGAFAAFLAAVEAGSIQRGTILIIEAWDRLSREPAISALHQMTGIIRAGIKIVTLVDKQEHDEATVNAQPHKLFHSLAMIIAANAESALKGERVANSWEKRRKRAVTGQRMTSSRRAWLDVDPTGVFVPNDGAKTVQRIFEMAAGGMGCYTIARVLQAEFLKTGNPVPLSGGKKSKGWNKTRIQNIIQSDAPLGVMHAHTMAKDGKTRVSGEKIEGYYPAIVEQTLANRARAQLKSRAFGGDGAGARGKHFTNLLARVAKCGVCGSGMVLTNRNLKKLEWGWLRCSDAYNHIGCTNNASIRYPDLEEAVLRDVGWYQTLQKHLPRHDPSHELAEQIAAKQAEAERINASLSALIDTFGEKPLSAIAAQIKERAERHSAIESEVAELRQQHQLASHKAEIPDLLSERDKALVLAASVEPQKRYEARARIAMALRETIDAILCMPDKTARVCFPTIAMPSIKDPLCGSEAFIRNVSFALSYNFAMKSPMDRTRMLMSVDPPLADFGSNMDITGFAPSLLLAGLHDMYRPEGTPPAIRGPLSVP